jgi:hypothetical protein
MKVTAKVVEGKINFDISLTSLDFSNMLCDSLTFHHNLQKQIIEKHFDLKRTLDKSMEMYCETSPIAHRSPMPSYVPYDAPPSNG